MPKTAGNSIQNILRDYSEDEIIVAEHQDGLERFGIRNERYGIKKHSTLSHYKSVLEPDVFESLYKFATIRNPWDRMISFYFSPHRGVVEWNRNIFIAMVKRLRSLRQFVCSDLKSGKIDSEIDFLIRFENLDEDFSLVCRKLGIPETRLPKRNQSMKNHYSTYYDSELIKIVENKFAEEIEYGNYRFENA